MTINARKTWLIILSILTLGVIILSIFVFPLVAIIGFWGIISIIGLFGILAGWIFGFIHLLPSTTTTPASTVTHKTTPWAGTVRNYCLNIGAILLIIGLAFGFIGRFHPWAQWMLGIGSVLLIAGFVFNFVWLVLATTWNWVKNWRIWLWSIGGGLIAITLIISLILCLVGSGSKTNLPTTPGIYSSTDGTTFSNKGEYLDTNLGKRMTFTCRKVVVPTKEWNDPLTAAELKAVETTWVTMKVDVPDGMTGTVFAGGIEQGINRYENGVLLTLDPGHYEFNIRNGEIVLWYPDQVDHQTDDLNRIFEQIRNGNFDIKAPLAFFGVSADILPKVPTDLVKKINSQIIPDLITNTK